MIRKPEYITLPYSSAVLRGFWNTDPECAIGWGLGTSAEINLHASRVYALIHRHDWSGQIVVRNGPRLVAAMDLYSPYPVTEVVSLAEHVKPQDVHVVLEISGKCAISNSSELVLRGLLVPKEEAPAAPAEPTAPAMAFAELQSGMVDRFGKSALATGKTYEDLYAERVTAYRMRVAEALVYVGHGQKMLDIGAGYLCREVLEDILARGVEYYTLDLDPRTVEHNRALFPEMGIPDGHAFEGINTSLPFPALAFDAVFSSHCLEHSPDLERTFAEICRVLTSGGRLIYAVPLGWDRALEHIYAMSAEEWITLTEQCGFNVLAWHVGRIYDTTRHDLLIVAAKH